MRSPLNIERPTRNLQFRSVLSILPDLQVAAVLCVLLVMVSFFYTGCSAPDSAQLKSLVESQMALYPEMGVQDWYKLLHQSAMGNRHLGVEDSVIYNYMLKELNSIEASTSEPLIEYISTDSTVIRMNLRPFKAIGGDPDDLFAAMKSTWDTVVPSAELLEVYWNDLGELAKSGQLRFTHEELDTFFQQKKAEGFPAVHHSDLYGARYKPAYRVLLRSTL